ncbi:PTS transporter subunit IIC [Klebsiella pneumoniae]|uniref:PTS transporter subunit IIC n=1 Tax=Klebsiella pneumoniae TaxID=573 RepID=UPI0022475F26|nr:PTS transporter subunit IIC [Klebsiella pneumoniae]MCW9240967.1 hypothetical protein [Klebsiella pneumoniae]
MLHFLIYDVLGTPAILVGLFSLIGLLLQKKGISDVISGTLKTIMGFVILTAGAGIISFHPETANNKIFRLLNQIKDAGKKCGVVLNPATPAESIAEYAHLLDKVTVMSVDPGYAGQKFIPESLNKIRKLINMRKNNGYHYLTEIDGSCNEKTFGQIAESGVDVFIVGTSGLFSLHEDVSQAWDRMIEIFQRETVAA